MPEPTNHSYMLRLWRERADAPWRVTLIAVAQVEQRRQFDTLEEWLASVRAQAAAPNKPSAHQEDYCSADGSG